VTKEWLLQRSFTDSDGRDQCYQYDSRGRLTTYAVFDFHREGVEYVECFDGKGNLLGLRYSSLRPRRQLIAGYWAGAPVGEAEFHDCQMQLNDGSYRQMLGH
jgi:hypothetical protein